MELSQFITLFPGAKKSGGGYIARCPAHDDKNPSLSISNGGGKILLHCHAGCTPEAIVGAIGLSMKDLRTDNGNGAPGPREPARKIIAVHRYTDEKGNLLFEKPRFNIDPKTKPRHRGPDGKWRWGTGTERRPLYRLTAILKAREVIVCEGEKDADNLCELGFEATTTAFGNWLPENIETLTGKQVWVVGDNDRTGKEKVKKAVEALSGHAGSVKIIELPLEGKPQGYDVSDFIAEFDEPDAAAEKFAILMEQARAPETPGADKAFPPLTPEKTQVAGKLTQEPPDPDSILLYNMVAILIRKVVAQITATGGTGKTFFVLQLAYVLASGTGLGPLKAANKFRVLAILGEDPDDEIERRLWRIGKGDFPESLFVASVAGKLPPLMHLVEGNPQTSPAFDWLKKTIESHLPLDILIIDPKSRFYGLEENNNDHNTQWVSCLEALVIEYDLTVIFTHHASKQRAQNMDVGASRGGQALTDACRWVANMTRMSDDTAKRYDIADARNYIEFDITKSNYAAQLPSKFVFKRTENGLLEYAALEADRRLKIKRMIYKSIRGSGQTFSRRDLTKNENEGRKIIAEIKNEVETFKHSLEMDGLLNELIRDGLMEEIRIKGDKPGPAKLCLNAIPVDPENVYQKWL